MITYLRGLSLSRWRRIALAAGFVAELNNFSLFPTKKEAANLLSLPVIGPSLSFLAPLFHE